MRLCPRIPARTFLTLVSAGAVVLGSGQRTAHATHCSPALSTCIDADNLWPYPGSGPFLSIEGSTTTPPAQPSLGLVLSYLARAIGLRVASPDPKGTVIYALDNMFDESLLLSLGLTDRVEVTLAAPVTLFQDGAGLSDVLGTDAQLPRSVVRDPRIGASFAILPRPRTGPPDGLAVISHLDLGIPLGDKDAFAGAATATVVPSIAAEYRIGRFQCAAQAGARVRGSSTLGRTTVGSQLAAGLGTAVDILP